MAEQTEIAYEGKEWQSYQTGGTLVRAVDLNNMEKGISDACAGVDELRTKRLPTYVVAQDGDTATQDVYTEDILGPCLILDLATRTTYYETGGGEDGHRKAITSGDDIDELRDSLSRKVEFRQFRKCYINIQTNYRRVSIYMEDGEIEIDDITYVAVQVNFYFTGKVVIEFMNTDSQWVKLDQ